MICYLKWEFKYYLKCFSKTGINDNKMLELLILKAKVTLREFHFYGALHWLKVNTVISFLVVVVLFLRERFVVWSRCKWKLRIRNILQYLIYKDTFYNILSLSLSQWAKHPLASWGYQFNIPLPDTSFMICSSMNLISLNTCSNLLESLTLLRTF